MEKLVQEGKITVSKVMGKSSGENFRLGEGEKSVLDYYMANDIDLIVSDDEAFLKMLDTFEISFTPVAGVILLSVINGLINKEKGIKYLEMLKPMIKEEHIDTISALKQMIREGAELYLINQYSNGKTSKGKLAELLDLDMYEVNELLEKYHVKASISYDRFTRGIKTAEETAKSQKGRA